MLHSGREAATAMPLSSLSWARAETGEAVGRVEPFNTWFSIWEELSRCRLLMRLVSGSSSGVWSRPRFITCQSHTTLFVLKVLITERQVKLGEGQQVSRKQGRDTHGLGRGGGRRVAAAAGRSHACRSAPPLSCQLRPLPPRRAPHKAAPSPLVHG
ncbi:hypothetical protein E2C01_031298 [Portunus trituberculatus]|uniref:Uncharacterized protein n=1 Tax=Portunus trituberculatus TaxID=210409 RepID=A0A5B7EWH3_PORTR|nr:hypothetical protein [Portunus trituberculatus]